MDIVVWLAVWALAGLVAWRMVVRERPKLPADLPPEVPRVRVVERPLYGSRLDG